jgi:eukaryotic-like serine/threonine-protein kinase
MSLKDFLFSKVFVKNLAIAFGLLAGILMILLIWLNIYTRHGQARPVPDFYGLSLSETAKLAKKNKLRYQVVDSVYTTIVPAGCVAEQTPVPGFKVKKRRRILLTINAFKPEMVKVPDLVALSIKQAVATIENSGLTVGDITYIPDLSVDFVKKQLYKGRVVSEKDSLQKGSPIDLVLGKGFSNQKTLVPNLVGLKLDEARTNIIYASLTLAAIGYDNSVTTDADTLKAFVYRQIPEYKETSTLQLGAGIYLWLTVDSSKLPVDSTTVVIPVAGQDTVFKEENKKESKPEEKKVTPKPRR